MGTTILGMTKWGLVQDDDGQRDYFVQWKIEASSKYVGPSEVLQTVNLPAIGSNWGYWVSPPTIDLIDGAFGYFIVEGPEFDTYAFCTPEHRVSMILEGEPNRYWLVEQVFTTRPLKRCLDQRWRNPIWEPPKIGGSFVHEKKKQDRDKDDKLIQSSSMEAFNGDDLSFDISRPTIEIECNLLFLPLTALRSMINRVNDVPLWGFAARKLKLSGVSWEKLYYGKCLCYYRVKYEFETGDFDKFGTDYGTRFLSTGCPGYQDPDAIDPATGKPWNKDLRNFEAVKDGKGNTFKLVPLDGKGRRVGPGVEPAKIPFLFYKEANFASLGLPEDLEVCP